MLALEVLEETPTDVQRPLPQLSLYTVLVIAIQHITLPSFDNPSFRSPAADFHEWQLRPCSLSISNKELSLPGTKKYPNWPLSQVALLPTSLASPRPLSLDTIKLAEPNFHQFSFIRPLLGPKLRVLCGGDFQPP